MNFTDKIKSEILSKPIKDKHCKKAFVAGLIRGSGVLYEKDGELGVEFKVPDEQTAMTITTIFSQLFNYDIREVSVATGQNNKEKFYLNVNGEQTVEILTDLGILIENDGDIAVDLKFFGEISGMFCYINKLLLIFFI